MEGVLLLGKINIGVLSLQGSFREHIFMLNNLEGVESSEVRSLDSLQKCDGLIIPGGESSTMGKLLVDFGIKQQLIDRIRGGMPVWGTCAGAILLANRILDEDYVHLSVMNMEVRRNAYGGQLDSFTSNVTFPDISKVVQGDKAEQGDKFIIQSEHGFPTVFIRAPLIESVGENCKILGRHQGKIIAVQENNMLATTFHPEITNDLSFHRYFSNMITGALRVVKKAGK